MKPPKWPIAILLLTCWCLTLIGPAFLRQDPAPGSPVDNNFTAFRAKKLGLPARRAPVCLVAVGDIMLSRGVAWEISKSGNTQHPFKKVKDYLKTGDVVFGNLENPVTAGRETMPLEMVLRADPGVEAGLKDAGFTVLSLANNHTPDFGPRGLLDTLQRLDRAGIRHAGAGKTESEALAASLAEVKGMKFAFLAFNDPGVVPDSYRAGPDHPGTAFTNMEKMAAAVRETKGKAGFVVVSMHAGTEYAEEPDQTQVQFARRAVDAGADLVLGHHPHVIQRVEQYKGKYIFYSLGNFVFDQKWSRATREGLAVKFFIGAGGVEKVEFLPVYINDRCQPQAMTGGEAEAALKKLKLDLLEEAAPVWDGGSQTIREGRRFAVFSLMPPGDYRLIKEQDFDLDQDGTPEKYTLRDGRLKVENKSTVWESPEDWWVDDFFLGDSTNGGNLELNLLVWKAGSFGPCRPFWVTREDMSVKNHLFIFKPAGGSFKPVWQSSNLDRPIFEPALSDLDGDGQNELVVAEGSYANTRVRRVGVWKWNGWGFSKMSGERT
ncbi:MAG: CapA family protein [Eubacteriales bacterium]